MFQIQIMQKDHESDCFDKGLQASKYVDAIWYTFPIPRFEHYLQKSSFFNGMFVDRYKTKTMA
jgi:hypothetical protein